jgi:hypothetical protein
VWPIAALTIVMGVAPAIWLNAIELGAPPKPQTTQVDAQGELR